MYFNSHPIKVCLIEIGQIQRKVRYIRVLGDDIAECFRNFLNKLTELVGQNQNDFICFWMDYASDELEICTLDDFWCWVQFLEKNTMVHPEVFIKPVFVAPVPRQFFQAVPPTAYSLVPRPQFTQPTYFRTSAQPFVPARFQPPQQGHHQHSQNDSGYRTINNSVSRNELLNGSAETTPSPPRATSWSTNTSHLSPIQKDCLDKLKTRYTSHNESWLIGVVQKVDGDFHSALTIVEEELNDTEDNFSD